MSNCSICERKITRLRSQYLNTNICIECMSKIKNNDYVLSSNNNEINDDLEISSAESKSGTLDSSGENVDLFVIHSGGKEVTVTEEIGIAVESKPVCCMENYKDALLASLYSQLEFLKN